MAGDQKTAEPRPRGGPAEAHTPDREARRRKQPHERRAHRPWQGLRGCDGLQVGGEGARYGGPGESEHGWEEPEGTLEEGGQQVVQQLAGSKARAQGWKHREPPGPEG